MSKDTKPSIKVTAEEYYICQLIKENYKALCSPLGPVHVAIGFSDDGNKHVYNAAILSSPSHEPEIRTNEFFGPTRIAALRALYGDLEIDAQEKIAKLEIKSRKASVERRKETRKGKNHETQGGRNDDDDDEDDDEDDGDNNDNQGAEKRKTPAATTQRGTRRKPVASKAAPKKSAPAKKAELKKTASRYGLRNREKLTDEGEEHINVPESMDQDEYAEVEEVREPIVIGDDDEDDDEDDIEEYEAPPQKTAREQFEAKKRKRDQDKHEYSIPPAKIRKGEDTMKKSATASNIPASNRPASNRPFTERAPPGTVQTPAPAPFTKARAPEDPAALGKRQQKLPTIPLLGLTRTATPQEISGLFAPQQDVEFLTASTPATNRAANKNRKSNIEEGNTTFVLGSPLSDTLAESQLEALLQGDDDDPSDFLSERNNENADMESGVHMGRGLDGDDEVDDAINPDNVEDAGEGEMEDTNSDDTEDASEGEMEGNAGVGKKKENSIDKTKKRLEEKRSRA